MGSMALDFSTYVVSFAIAMGMFGIFRKTVDWPQTARVLILVATVFTAAVSNTLFDLVYTDWVAANVESSWNNLQRTLERSEEHTSELQSLMRISYAVFCLTKKE